MRAVLFAWRAALAFGVKSRLAFGLALAIALAIVTVTRRSAAEPAPATDSGDAGDASDGGTAAARRGAAEAVFRQAEHDDDALDFAHALARFDEARALDPGSRYAPRAEARAAALRTHAEGDFVPLAKLERVRRDPSLSSDPRAVEDLLRDAESFPPGLVRVEAWVLCAEAYAHRFGRPRDAEPLLERVLADPLADAVMARKAARDLVTLRIGRGDLAGAEDAVRQAGLRADPALARDLHRAVRRRRMHVTSIAILAAMLLLAGRAAAVGMRRGAGARMCVALARTWKIALAYAGYVAIVGALLASGYEAGTMRPFLYFGLVLLPIVLVARAWAAAGGESLVARGGRAALCAMSTIAAAFLVLEGVDVTFLDGMGL